MKNKIVTLVVVFCFVFAAFGVAYATTDWDDDNIFNGTINWFKNGIRIGQQGTGGVTFFNGTIVNETTTDDVDNPVAFGDNVRIDGEIWRGEESGPGDDMPIKLNDDVLVYGTLTGDLAADTVVTDNIADDAVTNDKVDFTTRGFAKAGGLITDAAITQYFNNVGGSYTLTNPAVGAFTLTVPGVAATDYVLASISGDEGVIRASVISANTIRVYTASDIGTDANLDFTFVIF